MKVFKKSLAAAGAVIIAFSNVCSTGNQLLIGNMSAVNAETYSDELEYGDYLSYRKVDDDEDGTYDYIEISRCDSSVVSVEIPSEIDGLPVTSIGERAFYYCSGLKSVTIPDSVTEIGSGAFSDCSNLTSVIIPEGVTVIGTGAFGDCSSLTSVTIPDSVTYIGIAAFYGTSFLENQTGVKYAGKWVVGCDNDVTEAKIKSGSKGIADRAFFDCENLTSVTIPNSVTEIGELAFYCCSSLESINVSGNNNNYISVDGVLFNKEKTKLIQYPGGSTGLEYIIPESVTEIGEGAFSGCSSLTSVTIPEGVTVIERDAFSGCSSLTSVTIPEGVTVIKRDAFSGCSSLTSVTIPEGVTVIEWGAFGGCSNLTSVTIPDSVTEIGEAAFSNCSKLTSVTIENPECEIYGGKWTIYNGYDENTEQNYYNGVIRGYESSTAQAYAEKYGYEFESLGEKPAVLKGDVNRNGMIDPEDIAIMQKCIVGSASLSYYKISVLDMNDDGVFNVYDVVELKRTLK